MAAHLASQDDIDQNAGLVGLALEQFGDWVTSAEPEQLPDDLITLVAALAGMTAWFARYFTGDVPEDWDLDELRTRDRRGAGRPGVPAAP